MKMINLPSVISALATVAVVTSGTLANAATWTTVTSGTALWTDDVNWQSGSYPESVSGAVVDLSQADLLGNVTITLPSVTTTLGVFNIGTSGATGSYTIAPNGTSAKPIQFDNDTVNSQINVVATSQGDTISAPVTIAGNGVLDITNNSGKNLTISGVISGSDGGESLNLLKGGLVLSATTNAFTGGINIQGGTLLLSNAQTGNFTVGTAGTGPITLGATSGPATDAALLYGYQNSVNTVTVTNDISVLAGNDGKATIGQTGTAINQALLFSKAVTLNKDTYLTSGNGTVTFAGGIAGAGDVTVVSTGGQISSDGQIFGNPMGTVSFTTNNTYTGDTRIESGIVLVATGGGDLNTAFGSSTNDIVLGGASGALTAEIKLKPTASGTLSRNIVVQAGSAGYAEIYQEGQSNTISGNIILNKSLLVGAANYASNLNITGVISSAAGAIGGQTVVKTGDRYNIVNLYANNTYNGGTIVAEGAISGTNTVTNYLGTGNAEVEGGYLYLANKAALAAGKTVLVDPNGMLITTFNPGGTNPLVNQAYLQSIIDPRSSGGFAPKGGLNGALDLSGIGNGYMYLGAASSGDWTYNQATLGANLDGNYRLGFGGGNLTIANGLLVDGANGGNTHAQLIVGGTMGNTNSISSAAQQNVLSTYGKVTLTGTQSYTGGTIINKESTLVGTAQLTGNPFGDDTNSMTLHNAATLQLNNNGTQTTTTKMGALSFDGSAFLGVAGTTGGANTLQIDSLVRNGKGVLAITAGAAAGSVLGTSAIVKVTNAPDTISINGGADTMVAPYYYDNTAATYGFLTYDATKGFIDAVAGQTVAANGAINLTGADSYVKTAAAATIASSGTVAALQLGGNLTTTGGDKTLNISSGGLLTPNINVNIGSNTAGQKVNLDFGSAEGVIINWGNLAIYNQISGSGGITKAGVGALQLLGINNFTGTVNVQAGTIQLTNDNQLGDAANSIVLDGGGLNFTSGGVTLGASRAMTIGTNGGTIINGSKVNPVTIAGEIGGSGVYFNLVGATMNVAGVTPAVVALTNTNNTFSSMIQLSNLIALQFDNAGQLGTGTNAINLIGGNATLLYTGDTSSTNTTVGRALAFLDQGGAVDVKNANGTLTVSGPISGSGMFNKNGLGKLVLTGSSSATGNLSINAGVLNIRNADALGTASSVVTGSYGVSGGAAFVQAGAALEIENNIAVGDKTLYLNGGGIGGTGALRNISGNNSIAGTVVVQSDTIIGADAGSLTLSGSITSASAVTKVGAGKVTLSGNNSIGGGLTASNGILAISGTTSAAVNVNSGATLTNSGWIKGAVNVSGDINGRGTVEGTLTIKDGGELASGNGSGLTTVHGDLVVEDAATVSMRIDSVSIYDQIIVTGELTLGGSLQLSLGSISSDSVFTLIDNQGAYALSSAFDYVGLTVSGTTVNLAGIDSVIVGDMSYSLSYGAGVGGDVTLSAIAAVPEPSTWVMLVGGLGCLVGLQRFRRSNA